MALINGLDIIPNRPHSKCCVRFCKNASLLKPGRTPGSAGCWERFCGKHLPANMRVSGERIKLVSAEGFVAAQKAIAERKRQVQRAQVEVKFATEPATLGEMVHSGERERSGWGKCQTSKLLHFFKRGSYFALCGRHFTHNQSVTPNFAGQCKTCLAKTIFSREALR